MRAPSSKCCMAAAALVAAACGFDWSLPEAGGEGGGGGSSTTTGGAGPGTGGMPHTTSSSPDVGGFDNTGGQGQPEDCETCALAATEQTCAQQAEQCSGTEGCLEISECATNCGAAPDCIQQCTANASDEAIAAFNAVLLCVICEACADACPEYQEQCG